MNLYQTRMQKNIKIFWRNICEENAFQLPWSHVDNFLFFLCLISPPVYFTLKTNVIWSNLIYIYIEIKFCKGHRREVLGLPWRSHVWCSLNVYFTFFIALQKVQLLSIFFSFKTQDHLDNDCSIWTIWERTAEQFYQGLNSFKWAEILIPDSQMTIKTEMGSCGIWN